MTSDIIVIPVFLVDRQGKATSDFINSCPCVRLTLRNAPDTKHEVALGMIDTGASGAYVDTQLVEKLGAPVLRPETVHGATSIIQTTLHSGIFEIENVKPLSLEYSATPLRATGRSYDVVLGRSVISLFKLEIDRGRIILTLPQD
ncbi:hypothetical protein [Mesorhizobium sp. INR15]|uniref:hypothetical protein n=1 Tax=Mesorhizobium sp. INR15 TaxID=2654248 RepID=UPI0018965615|nr:hypothetical protein [Mesorhizobium sp. INR15]QPC93543.1 hypothetical protein GA829_24845 [Mesorhizobium sp. INR15]